MFAVERFFQFSLLGLVTAGFLAVAGSGFLDTPTIALVCVGLLFRAVLLSGTISWQIPKTWVNAATLAYIGFFALDYFRLSGALLPATVHLIFFLAIAKILTARTTRDYTYTAAIALMELIAAALLSVNINFFLFLAVYVLFGIAAFTSGEIRRAMEVPGRAVCEPGARIAPRLTLLTGTVALAILALTGGLFIILPRTANATFRHLLASRYHLTGFSDQVTLGQIGEIQKDSRAVMHVRPYSKRMPADLKWRGASLSRFDGRHWSEPAAIAGQTLLPQESPVMLADRWQRSRTDGARYSYGVELNTGDSDALFVAGIPEFLNVEHLRVSRNASGTYRVAFNIPDNIRYEVSSFVPRGTPAPHVVDLTSAEQARYLQLPRLDSRIAPLARNLAGSSLDPFAQATELAAALRSRYSYTLDLLSAETADPLANFLFDRRAGHCEYFASAMTVALRTLGTPARLVNGFQSGTLNPLSGLYVIRASDAHTWVEAFLPGRGWTVFDPTPSALRPPASRVAMMLDAADTFWQQWVVNYDLSRQVTLAQKLEEGTRQVRWTWHPDLPGWRAAALAAAKPLAAIGFAIFVFTHLPSFRRRRKPVSASDATVLYRKMLHVLTREGYVKTGAQTPTEFADSLPDSPMAALVQQFTSHYQALRFGHVPEGAGELPGLLNQLRKL